MWPMWLKLKRDDTTRPVPILVISDCTTRLAAARLIASETTNDFIQVLERAWIRHFGIMNALQVDEHRAWCSEQMRQWASENNCELMISPGQAHERLSILERRHQVVRRAVELFLLETKGYTDEGIIQALCYVMPQVNRMPNVHGFSPLQWTVGYTPNMPGSMIEENIAPSQLTPSEAFRQKMHFQEIATHTIATAGNDDRHRRALLRQYRGNTQQLTIGQRCHYFRDLPTGQAALGPKIVWRGQAVVVMVDKEQKMYWIVHGTSLIRASFEHTRPILNSSSAEPDKSSSLDRAQQALQQIRGRGVTQYLDLTRSNKRKLEDLQSDEEEEAPDDKEPTVEEILGLPPEPHGLKRNLTTHDSDIDGISDYTPSSGPEDPGPAKAPRLEPEMPSPPMSLPLPPELERKEGDPTGDDDKSLPMAEQLVKKEGDPTGDVDESYKRKENETFSEKARRFNQQETISFGPARAKTSTEARATPYSNKPLGDDSILASQEIGVDLLGKCQLPEGWSCENGFVVMDSVHDTWELRGSHLIVNHYLPRTGKFMPTAEDCPIKLAYLSKDRDSYDGHRHLHDRWKQVGATTTGVWTGQTKFKINACDRKAAREQFFAVSSGQTTMAKKADNEVSERHLCLADRLAFTKAKQKELESFFTNNVWSFDDPNTVPGERILTARFILTWKTQPDKSVKAKARLVLRGFQDPDALAGALNTNSPTLTRLSRGMILSICEMLQFRRFTSDISTAFLQGKPHGPERVLWVRLPKDAQRLLGIQEGDEKVMKLHKSMYGLVDAPRSWYVEAVSRILSIPGIIQHPLDACLFMTYDDQQPNQLAPQEPGALVGLFGIHVDDLVGGGNMDSPRFQEVKAQLQKLFTCRMWLDSGELEYCGCKIEKKEGHTLLHQSHYLRKMKPISLPEARKKEPTSALSDKETSMLRGLLGGLQWSSTQTAPFLQCSASQLSGEITKATVDTIDRASKVLRMAKANSDAGLRYHALGGDPKEVSFIGYTDASFASRKDLSSRGGFLAMMVHQSLIGGTTGEYNIIDWRSWRLPRVARSSLSAESQAASECADALLFISTFWKIVWQPHLPLEDEKTPLLPHAPALILDAKALYDLLTKDEIQAACGADKRTAIETLVCQDKLKACQATVKWVSSEMQYADSLTKQESSQLLADRMRTHITKIVSDEGFQAAKKKDARTRKKNTEMFAVKRAARAMQAMFCMGSTTIAHATSNDTTTTPPPSTSSWVFWFTILFGLLLLLPLFGTMSALRSLVRRHEPSDTDEDDMFLEDNTTDSSTQTDSSNVTEVGMMTEWDLPLFERRLRDCTRQLTDLQVNHHTLHQEHQALMDEHEIIVNDREALIEALNKLKEAYDEVKEQRDTMKAGFLKMEQRYHEQSAVLFDVRFRKDMMVKDRIVRIMEQMDRCPLYFSKAGRVFHRERECLECRSVRETQERMPCSLCIGAFGRSLLRQAREVMGIPTDDQYWSYDFYQQRQEADQTPPI